MGKISIRCTASTGSRILGLSYASDLRSLQLDTSTYDGLTHILLVGSNENPSSYGDLSWGLISAWRYQPTELEINAPMECHYNANSQVFTLMSNFRSSVGANSTNVREPGGYQYSFASNSWSSFTLSTDYLWGDASATFTIFSFPGSSDTYQANIADSTNGTVNIGVLNTSGDGKKVFVNSGQWILDPNKHGYPVKIGFGNNEIYQIGSIVTNNRTGSFRTQLTRIPLSGVNRTPYNMSIPGPLASYLPIYNLQDFQNCSVTNSVVRYSGKSIYVICQVNPVSYGGSRGNIYGPIIGNNNANNSEINDEIITSKYVFTPRYTTNHLQLFDGGVNFDTWGYDPVGRSILNLTELYFSNAEDDSVSISDPYNDPINLYVFDTHESKLTIGLSVGIPLFIALIVSLLIWRNWSKVREVVRGLAWSNWKGGFKSKVIEIVSKIDDGKEKDNNYTDSKISNMDEDRRSSELLHNKIEDMSLQSIEYDIEGKILVTPDMDLDDIDNKVVGGYLENSTFGTHPRPVITTSISIESVTRESNLSQANTLVYSHSENPSTARRGSSASVSSTVLNRHVNIHNDQPKQNIPGSLDARDMIVEDTEDHVPPYIESTSYSIRRNLETPSAPPLEPGLDFTSRV